jgi:hypothetical protein
VNNRVIAVVVFAIISITITLYLQHKKEGLQLKESVDLLVEQNKQLQKKLTLCETTCKEPICGAGADYQGDVRYIDCGESFIERWATCVCTTMCLEDFTVVVTNRARCRNWPSVPIQIRPEPEDTDEEDE